MSCGGAHRCGQDCRILPVNQAGDGLFGEPVARSLAEAARLTAVMNLLGEPSGATRVS
jgi:hypothetical protein